MVTTTSRLAIHHGRHISVGSNACRMGSRRQIPRPSTSSSSVCIQSCFHTTCGSVAAKNISRMRPIELMRPFTLNVGTMSTHFSIFASDYGVSAPNQSREPRARERKNHSTLAYVSSYGGEINHSSCINRIHQCCFSTSGIPVPPMEKSSFKVTKVSYDGDMKTINLPPSEILKRTSILPRDLVSLNLTTRHERYMDLRTGKHRFTNRPPPTAILPRSGASSSVTTSDTGTSGSSTSDNASDKACILLSFGLCRAVATRHSVYLFDVHRPVAKEFAQELATIFATGQYKHVEPSPELIFLEAVLRDTTETYSRRIRLYEPIVDDVLERVASEVFNENGSVHQLSPLKDSLQTFEMQVQKAHECLTELLNDDEEMLQLLLTEQAIAKESGQPVDFERHQHVELLIGGYARQISSILQEINFLLSRIQSKQEFVQLALAGYRNRLIYLNVIVGIAGVSTGIATAIAGFFGMNLVSGLETSTVAFGSVVAVSAGTSGLIAAICMNYLSGRTMQQRATQRLFELETLTAALSDMSALDFTIKRMTDDKTKSVNRDQFKQELMKARRSGRATDEEVDLLFNVFDRVKDGQLSREDFIDEITSSASSSTSLSAPHTAS